MALLSPSLANEDQRALAERSARISFEMIVSDVFALEGGRTALAGEIVSGPTYIPGCDCELLVDDAAITKLKIEGEMLPLKRIKNDLRAVSTLEAIDVSLLRRSNGRCRLRST